MRHAMVGDADRDLYAAVREAWQNMAPEASWRGYPTGVNPVGLVAMAELVHQSQPALVVVADVVGRGGLPLFLGDCMDQNRRGKLVAWEEMSMERRRSLPTHRRVQWLAHDVHAEDLAAAERLAGSAAPVLVVTSRPARLHELVSIGSYLIVLGDEGADLRVPEGKFLLDPSRDPEALSGCSWLLRVPA